MVDTAVATVTLVGESPYIPSLLLRDGRDPLWKMEYAAPTLPDGRPGVPAASIKAMLKQAAEVLATMRRVRLQMALLHVVGEGPDALVPLEGEPEPFVFHATYKTHAGRATRGSQYPAWRLTCRVRYAPAVLSADAVGTLFYAAGSAVGLGSLRSADYGRFRLEAFQQEGPGA